MIERVLFLVLLVLLRDLDDLSRQRDPPAPLRLLRRLLLRALLVAKVIVDIVLLELDARDDVFNQTGPIALVVLDDLELVREKSRPVLIPLEHVPDRQRQLLHQHLVHEFVNIGLPALVERYELSCDLDTK